MLKIYPLLDTITPVPNPNSVTELLENIEFECVSILEIPTTHLEIFSSISTILLLVFILFSDVDSVTDVFNLAVLYSVDKSIDWYVS